MVVGLILMPTLAIIAFSVIYQGLRLVAWVVTRR